MPALIAWALISATVWAYFVAGERKRTIDVVVIAAVTAMTWPIWGLLLLYDGTRDMFAGRSAPPPQ